MNSKYTMDNRIFDPLKIKQDSQLWRRIEEAGKSAFQILSRDEKELYNLHKSAGILSEYMDNLGNNQKNVLGITDKDLLELGDETIYHLGHLTIEKPQNKALSYINVTLDSMIAKSRWPEPIILFRATFLESIQPFISNDIFLVPYHMPCSYNLLDIHKYYSGDRISVPVLLVLECEENMNMLPLDGNPDHGASEYEMLLPRYQSFEILQQYEIVEEKEIKEVTGIRINPYRKLLKYRIKPRKN